VRFWTDDGSCYGIPFYQVIAMNYRPRAQNAFDSFCLGSILVSGSKTEAFLSGFCEHKIALVGSANTTTGPQLPKYVSAAFGSLDLPWKPGHLRSAYGAICCHKFKPKNITDDIFLAEILGHKLLGPNASLSVGQSYKDFYIRKP
jgi:hypothetical protein